MGLDKLPQVVDTNDVKTIRQAFDQIEATALTVEYGTATPTMLDYGRLYVKDDGSTRAVYIKTGKGTIIAI